MNRKGFTLVEIMIAITLGLVIMAAIYVITTMGQRSSTSIGQKVVTQQDTRAVLGLMAMEIRMASYNPTVSPTLWNTIPTATCASMGNVVPVMFRKGIQVAGTNRMLIAMDLTDPPAIPPAIGNSPSEYIEYAYNSANNEITRNVSCGGDNTILGGTDAGIGTKVVNAAAAVNLFTYWGPDIDHPDATGNCADIDITAKVSNAATADKWIPQIRRIVITIVAENELPDAQTQKTRRMIYSTGILVRNHVLSPPIAN